MRRNALYVRGHASWERLAEGAIAVRERHGKEFALHWVLAVWEPAKVKPSARTPRRPHRRKGHA